MLKVRYAYCRSVPAGIDTCADSVSVWRLSWRNEQGNSAMPNKSKWICFGWTARGWRS